MIVSAHYGLDHAHKANSSNESDSVSSQSEERHSEKQITVNMRMTSNIEKLEFERPSQHVQRRGFPSIVQPRLGFD